MQIHLLIFQTSTTRRFSYLLLDYYLSTYCGGPSFLLGYLCGEYFLRPYYNFCWMQPGTWAKWAFHTSPIAFGSYSKFKVESRSWLPKYHIGNKWKSPPTCINECLHQSKKVVLQTFSAKIHPWYIWNIRGKKSYHNGSLILLIRNLIA